MREKRGPVPNVSRVKPGRLSSAIIDAMGDGLVLIGMDGKITTVNPAFEKMTGYEKSELVGKESTEFMQKMVKLEDLENAVEDLIAVLETKVPIYGELTLVSKDGREIPVTFSVAVIKDTEGKPTNLIYNIKDITKLKKAVEEKFNADRQRIEQLEKFAKITVGRELKMVELKQRIKELEEKLKKPTEG